MFYSILNQSNGGDAASAGVSLIISLISLVLSIAVLIAMWKMFAKAGRPGWAAIIPIYNIYVLLQIIGRPGCLWLILLLIPLVNIVVAVLIMIDLAKVYGKGIGFAVGLIFLSPIFILILGFGDAKYIGPVSA